MRHFNGERIKSIAIISLLITSVIQVGILWGYQSHGTPTGFFTGIFGTQNKPLTNDAVREILFTPARLFISNGETNHWPVNRQNELFKQITDEAKGYLKSIVAGKLVRSTPSGDWGDITSKTGFLLEFGCEIPPELLKWFTGAPKVSGDAPPVFKMMIKPDSVDESMCLVSILDAGGNVSEYSVNNVSRPQTMQKILEPYEKDDGGRIYRNYFSVRDSKWEKNFPFAPDVMYVAKAPSLWPYYQIHASIPAKAARENELAGVMLGNEKDRYVKYEGKDYLQFSTTENNYKVYDDGNLTYKLLSDSGSAGRGDIASALVNAYSFIDRLNRLTNQKADIYLAGVDNKQPGYYSFSFDYRFNDMPVVINLQAKGGDSNPSRNAIEIDANDRKVLKCNWILREFAQGQKALYNDRFIDVMSHYGISYSKMQITDISPGYYLDRVGAGVLEPSLVIRLKDEDTPKAYGMFVGKGG